MGPQSNLTAGNFAGSKSTVPLRRPRHSFEGIGKEKRSICV
jgi:hypothetical protein